MDSISNMLPAPSVSPVAVFVRRKDDNETKCAAVHSGPTSLHHQHIQHSQLVNNYKLCHISSSIVCFCVIRTIYIFVAPRIPAPARRITRCDPVAQPAACTAHPRPSGRCSKAEQSRFIHSSAYTSHHSGFPSDSWPSRALASTSAAHPNSPLPPRHPRQASGPPSRHGTGRRSTPSAASSAARRAISAPCGSSRRTARSWACRPLWACQVGCLASFIPNRADQ